MVNSEITVSDIFRCRARHTSAITGPTHRAGKAGGGTVPPVSDSPAEQQGNKQATVRSQRI